MRNKLDYNKRYLVYIYFVDGAEGIVIEIPIDMTDEEIIDMKKRSKQLECLKKVLDFKTSESGDVGTTYYKIIKIEDLE